MTHEPGGGSHDELQGGSDRHPVRWPPWLRLVAGLVVAVGVGWAAIEGLDNGGLGGGAEGGVSASSSSSGQPSDVVPPGTPPTIGVAGPPCARTDHRRELTVSVGIENVDTRRVYVQGFRPVLPMGGLRATGGSMGFELCGDVARTQDTSLEPGQAIVVTMAFALPDECPAPYPVQVEVMTATEPDGTVFRKQLGVLNDLGGLRFRQCRGEQ